MFSFWSIITVAKITLIFAEFGCLKKYPVNRVVVHLYFLFFKSTYPTARQEDSHPLSGSDVGYASQIPQLLTELVRDYSFYFFSSFFSSFTIPFSSIVISTCSFGASFPDTPGYAHVGGIVPSALRRSTTS